MAPSRREQLRSIKRFPSLVKYLRDELDWPIESDDFEALTFEFTPEELGIDKKNAAKIEEIKRLRPLSASQPWGIFFVKFDRKKLPVVALRRLLNAVALKKRASANRADQAVWHSDDLLFISNYGEEDDRKISFAHFSQDEQKQDLPVLKVLGWDDKDTALHLDDVADTLEDKLTWDDAYDKDPEQWRKHWRAAFTVAHGEVVRTSKDMAVRLAELARKIRVRINEVLAIESEKGPIRQLMSAFQEALIDDLDEDGFADMYAQTIAYGLLSARVTNPSGGSPDDLADAMPITNPFLRELMEQFLHVGGRRRGAKKGAGIDFDELGVSEVVALLDAANMEAVLKDFGDKNPQEDPVIHFFEGFLEEYDKKAKKEKGVFYTPRPVVSFIVRSVDELLRSKFGLKDGLADTTTWGEIAGRIDDLEIPDGVPPDQPFVQVLDPATGTGTFLVEVIGFIHETMTDKWRAEGHGTKKIGSLWNDYVPKHLLTRLHGYELMMAPYAIAHMKLGIKLHETGYEFGSEERVRVFLTDSLEPAHDFSEQLSFVVPALAHEAHAVNQVKESGLFSVVVGNPPYLREKVKGPGEREGRIGGWVRFGAEGKTALLEDFLKPLSEAGLGVHAKLAYELSVMFWRMALWLAFERKGAPGIVAMISPRAYIGGPGHTGMRDCMRDVADEISVLDLGGDNRGARKSENIFDIETGVAIGICARVPGHDDSDCSVRYSEIVGAGAEKLASLVGASVGTVEWRMCDSQSGPFLPARDGAFSSWPLLSDIFPWQHSGTQFKRLWPIGESRMILERRWRHLINLPKDRRGSAFVETDARLVSGSKGSGRGRRFTGIADEPADAPVPEIQRYSYRTLDRQWALVDDRFADRIRPDLVAALGEGQLFAATLMSKQLGAGSAVTVTNCLPDMDVFCNRGAKDIIPLWRDPTMKAENLHPDLLAILSEELGREVSPQEVFAYCVAVLAGPAYCETFSDEMAVPGPRIPISLLPDVFDQGVSLGVRFVWLQTFGEVSLLDGEIEDMSLSGAAFVGKKIPEDEDRYPDSVEYDAATETLRVGDGEIGGVAAEVYEFSVSGFKPVRSWLRYRLRERGGRAGRKATRSELDEIRPRRWGFTSDLLELLWVVEACVAMSDQFEGFLSDATMGAVLLAEALPAVPPQLRKPPKRERGDGQRSLI